MASRAQPTPFSERWWTVDRPTLAALGALMLAGIILCLAASPPVAARIGLDPFHFVNRQIFFLIPAIAVMIATNEIASRHRVDLDTTIKTLADTGRDMNSKYKETSEAGLAQNLVLC